MIPPGGRCLSHGMTITMADEEVKTEHPELAAKNRQRKEQEQQRQQQVQSQMQSNQIQQSAEQQKKKPELANWQKVMDNGEYLRSAEMAEEANYNMIDGLMNNVRKKKDKDKPRESVLARLRLNQKKVAKQGKKQTQQKTMADDMERKKK